MAIFTSEAKNMFWVILFIIGGGISIVTGVSQLIQMIESIMVPANIYAVLGGIITALIYLTGILAVLEFGVLSFISIRIIYDEWAAK